LRVRLGLLAVLVQPAWAFAHAEHRERLDSVDALHWSFDPWVLASLALAAGFYLCGILRLWRASTPGAGVRRWQAGCFAGGWLTLVVALVTPLDPLGEVLFSAHMVQHELLMLVAAPLLVLGRPLAVFVWALPPGGRRATGTFTRTAAVTGAWRGITHPFTAWAVHALVLWAWHAPPLFQASVLDTSVHTAQHLSFLFAALLFWWTLLYGRPKHGGSGVAILYLLSTAMHTGVLGALLTFSQRIWYPVYAPLTPAWGMTPLEDQQLGGLIMWVPGGLVYLIAALWLAGRLLGEGGVAEPRR